MKSSWVKKSLGEVCEMIADGDWIESKDQSLSGIRLVQTGNVGVGVFRNKDGCEHFISPETFKRLKCTEIFGGDILISRLPDPVGRACVVPDLGQRLITAVDCSIVRLKRVDCLPDFFVYYASSNEWFNAVEAKCTGSTRKRISRKNLTRVLVPCPPLPEQKRIVARIEAAFEKIGKLKASAERNLNSAKELFQSALDGALHPKKGWVKKRLGEVCKITSVLVDPTEKKYCNLLHVGGANIVSEIGSLVDLKTAAEEKLKSGKFTFDESMVLYNKIRPYLKKVARPDFKGLCSADMYPLSPVGGVERGFLYYLLLSSRFTAYAIGESERAGMPKVNRESLFGYELKMPPSQDEQREIARTLDLLREKLSLLQQHYERQIADCAELRQSVLHEAFEGRL